MNVPTKTENKTASKASGKISVNYLRAFVPFTNLSESSLEQILQKAEIVDLEKDELVYAIGSSDEFIYYLLEGEICMYDEHGKSAFLSASSEQAKFAFGKLSPRPAGADVSSDYARVMRIDELELDILLSWNQQLEPYDDSDSHLSDMPSSLLNSELEVDEVEVNYDEWTMALLSCQAFYKIPPENVQQLSDQMKRRHYAQGAVVVTEGEQDDHFYVIREGRCKVIRQGEVVETLGPMDTFGEVALISDFGHDSTIEMLTEGSMMLLSKKDFFISLMSPMIDRVTLEQTKGMIKKGAVLIDARTKREFMHQRLVRSISFPLYLLRAKLDRLTYKKTYIVYCDTGKRSAVAAYLLKQFGYNAYLLDDPQQAFREIAVKE